MNDIGPIPHAPLHTGAMPLFEFHRTLLSDVSAQDEFRRALCAIIHGGESVLDVGTGTGLHAMFACQAGARIVYAVDQSPIVELAKAIGAANGFDERITFIYGAIQDTELPERVDVITTHLGLSDTLAILPDVAARHLRPTGVVVPASADLFVAPVECFRADEQIRFWDKPHYGLDFTPVRPLASRSRYSCRITVDDLLACGARVASLNFRKPSTRLQATAQFEIHRDGVLHGIGLWYIEHLIDGISISTGPSSAVDPKLWPNQFLPADEPIHVRQGDTIGIHVEAAECLAGDWRWQILV